MNRRVKKIILACADVCLIGFAFVMSFYFLSFYLTAGLFVHLEIYIVIAVAYLLVGERFKIFSRLNRYTSSKELIINFLVMTTATVAGLLYGGLFNVNFSLRTIVLAYLLSNLLLTASRVFWKWSVEYRQRRSINVPKRKRTLVIGAGAGANVLFNRLRTEHEIYQIIGVLDDDGNKQKTFIQDKPVLGNLQDLSKIALEENVEHIILAIPSLPPKMVEGILAECKKLHLTINTLPPIEEVLNKEFTIHQLREIDITDLLGRDEVKLDMKAISHELTAKVLLVTGAGGSIGSEICRQVSKFKPARLILLGHGENSIYQIHRELIGKYSDIDIVPLIADVQDRKKMFDVMAHYQPDIVYHAAAHKHVPLMEVNPIEAVKNNVHGTKNVAEASKAAHVGKFVMVSTDKAVNPPNVMGATKRVAEMIVQGLNEPGQTKFCAVRFGNVLGSRGSVVPLFKEQIAKGGPVTVTDFRMTRYFMTIPEASRLVIQAGALADGGEIFILDMGQPVKIHDLAKKVIQLSGFTEQQIPIVEAGIRPGEKLFEELLLSSETTDKNVFEKIFVGKVPNLPLEQTLRFVDSLEDNDRLKERVISFANNLGRKPHVEIKIPDRQQLEGHSSREA